MSDFAEKGNTDEAVAFLSAWHPDNLTVLTAIPPTGGGAFSATFEPGQQKAQAEWIQARQGCDNLYFTPNRVGKAFNGFVKPKKPDIEAGVCLHVDIDPCSGKALDAEQDRILAALRTYTPPPSVIVFSGGGYQGFWRLKKAFVLNGDANRIEQFEAYNRKVSNDLGGDNTHNVDRIMRLPGTINMPSKKKRTLGRVPTLAAFLK